MIRRTLSALTYANVMSTLAVFLVVAGGGAYAAAKLKSNSVSSANIKNGAIKSKDLANGAVTAGKLGADLPFVRTSSVKKISKTGTCDLGSQCGSTDIFSLGGYSLRLQSNGQMNVVPTCTLNADGPAGGRVNTATMERASTDPSNFTNNADNPLPGPVGFLTYFPNGAPPRSYAGSATLVFTGGPSGTMTATVALHGTYVDTGPVNRVTCAVTGVAVLAK